MSDLDARLYGSILGIAVGDAIGLPADVHRTIRSPWARGRLWDASRELDERRVARPLLPFVLDGLGAPLLMPTDDTEVAALALIALDRLGAEADPEELFAFWREHAGASDAWGGVAERAAARNADKGMVPPRTGSDHPADTSDSAVPAAIVLGVAMRGTPTKAAAFVREWTGITHHADGLDAALFAAELSRLLADDHGLEDAIRSASTLVTSEWLLAGLRKAEDADASRASDVLAAYPDLLATFSPRAYSAGGSAPETLPLAMIILRATRDQPELALALSMMFPRHSDSLPAIVGGLLGAARGAEVFEPTYGAALSALGGILYPSLAGVALTELASHVPVRRAAVEDEGARG